MNQMEEVNFAYRLRHALNEGLEHMPKAKTERLAQARKAALARKKAHAPAHVLVERTAGGNSLSGKDNPRMSWLGRMGLAIPVLALVLGLAAIYQVEEQERIKDIAEIDAAMLADELPLSAYLDHGFNAYLAKRGE